MFRIGVYEMTYAKDHVNNLENQEVKSEVKYNFLYRFKSLIGGNSGYIRFIILFGILFTILQISDLTITYFALQNPQNKELNPLYNQEWFVPFKLTIVFLIMSVMHRIPVQNRRMAKGAMLGMIYMYLFINFNNLYFLFNS
ncbi:MAG: hypothetical protein MPEBLZ_03526 [Candidatus Methanoperedens nitroreducens]|uniref:DUF5658 domain-containing protein n=2 Tax=Candidatus Methanoperedens TaxID=1392997 RepID=A0A0P8CGU2_9EURY|nr:MAG: hypothetical protein MPEBLZ_03526 [Candidatus Methanoperedens sp. BLZ1]MBZ0174191.1 DUF5658 family protein [Candidatus Methanoperedens nitroreducens]